MPEKINKSSKKLATYVLALAVIFSLSLLVANQAEALTLHVESVDFGHGTQEELTDEVEMFNLEVHRADTGLVYYIYPSDGSGDFVPEEPGDVVISIGHDAWDESPDNTDVWDFVYENDSPGSAEALIIENERVGALEFAPEELEENVELGIVFEEINKSGEIEGTITYTISSSPYWE